MPFDPEKQHRRSIRLKGYDYSQAGAYFVTICTKDRLCLFGEVLDGEMRLNDAGRMVWDIWNDLPNHYPGVAVDAFIVMPNHVHGIIILVGAGPRACPGFGQPQGVAPTMGLPDVVHRFKTMTTKRYVDGIRQLGWEPFRGRLWQRNYYEHIIRNEEFLNSIREYILLNPMRWDLDRENPGRTGRDDMWDAMFSVPKPKHSCG
mgnify:CR=1 FL=1